MSYLISFAPKVYVDPITYPTKIVLLLIFMSFS
jgi:hypothetical protein